MENSRIIFEDNHLLAVSKLPGELVQGDYTGDIPLLEMVREYIRIKYNKPGNVFTGLVHRLDRPTSGVVIFAKTSKALSRMNVIFESREVDKTYWALVREIPPKPEDRLVHYLRKDQKKNRSFVVKKGESGAKKAILQYRIIGKSKSYHLLEIKLETGRHHQIRVQLSAIGCPIKGDLKYGFSRSNKDASISLHARTVDFTHPVNDEKIHLEAPLPSGDKVWEFFREKLNVK